MSAMAESNKRAVSADDLQPLLSARWVLGPRHLAACLFFSAVFLFVNAMPLLDWAVWPDVYLGRWMLDHGSLPQADPAQPWSDAGRVVHTKWLSQLAFGAADRLGGAQAVSNLFTALTMACLVVLARVAYVRIAEGDCARTGTPPRNLGAPPGTVAARSCADHRVGLMVGGVASALAVGAGFSPIANVAVFGKLCFATLLWLLATVEASGRVKASAFDTAGAEPGRTTVLPWRLWAATAVLFALWANLHGSYLLGIGAVACCGLAAGCEAAWRTRSFRTVWRNPSVRTYMLLTATALVASWLNPYGPGLVLGNAAFLRSEYVAAMPHWRPLEPASPQGMVLLASAVLLAVLLRVSRRPVRVVDVLLPGVLGAAVLATRQAQGWYAMAWMFAAMPHVANVVSRRIPGRDAGPASGSSDGNTDGPADRRLTARDFAFTLLCGLTLYCAFSFAPGSQALLGGRPRPKGELVGSPELLTAADWLREHAPGALVYAAPAWSDFLLGHAGGDLRALLTSNVHWVPQGVRDDHARIAHAEHGWEAAADLYGVDTLVLSPLEHGALIGAVRRAAAWTIVYEIESVTIARWQGRPRMQEDNLTPDTSVSLRHRERCRKLTRHGPGLGRTRSVGANPSRLPSSAVRGWEAEVLRSVKTCVVRATCAG